MKVIVSGVSASTLAGLIWSGGGDGEADGGGDGMPDGGGGNGGGGNGGGGSGGGGDGQRRSSAAPPKSKLRPLCFSGVSNTVKVPSTYPSPSSMMIVIADFACRSLSVFVSVTWSAKVPERRDVNRPFLSVQSGKRGSPTKQRTPVSTSSTSTSLMRASITGPISGSPLR